MSTGREVIGANVPPPPPRAPQLRLSSLVTWLLVQQWMPMIKTHILPFNLAPQPPFTPAPPPSSLVHFFPVFPGQ